MHSPTSNIALRLHILNQPPFLAQPVAFCADQFHSGPLPFQGGAQIVPPKFYFPKATLHPDKIPIFDALAYPDEDAKAQYV